MLLRTVLVLVALALQAAYCQDAPYWVNVTDIERNPNNPKKLNEDIPKGSIIGTVTARDPQGFPVKYKLGGNFAEYLEINEATGQIKVVGQLDFEQFNELTITVTATDVEGLTTTYVTSISIIDANDNPPKFVVQYYNYDIAENAPVGYTVANITVTDIDYNQPGLSVYCDLNSTADRRRACEVFGLEVISYSNRDWRGRLKTKLPLDYEKEQSYSIRVYATDTKYTVPLEIQIGVSDVNDSPPRFVRALGITRPENQPAGTYLDWVSAVDTDSAQKRPIRYELYGNAEALQYFSVDPVQGNITTLKLLDYEDPNRAPGAPRFLLDIRAREILDGNVFPNILGNDSLTTATAQVSIRITDVNDHCPTFDKTTYTTSIRENIPQGSNVPIQMTVTDGDSGIRASFDLSLSPYSNIFAVRPNTGSSPASITIAVINSGAIDYESANKSYTLTVVATQIITSEVEPLNCFGTGTSTVIITIEDVNDNYPTFEPSTYTAQVIEDAGAGTFVTTVTAKDRDFGKLGQAGLRYSLSNDGSELFSIDSQGRVTVAACTDPRPGEYRCIDYEKLRRYDLSVRAVDNNGDTPFLAGTATLIIDVQDVNDNVPIFTENYIRSIREGEIKTTDELKLLALDSDQNRLVYSIIPNQPEAQLWQVNSSSGEVTAKRPITYNDLLYPDRGSFIFQAAATDGKYTASATVTIYVIDINDNTPYFTPSNYSIPILETTPGNSFVIQVTASDRDSPATGNGLVDISIDDGSLGKFVIQSNGTLPNNIYLGNIMTAPDATFDYDIRNRYFLTVVGRDRGNPSKTGTAYVTINILDTNNKNPYFDPPSQSVTVYENAAPGTSVTTVAAYDRDADKQLVISFGSEVRAYQSGQELIDPLTFRDLFAIDVNGRVTVNRKLDRDIVDFMTYQLVVQDVRVTPPQTGTGSLFIRILEFNDQAPQFEVPFYNLSIEEERPLAAFVGSLVARDEDDLIASYQLTYNPGNLFAIGLTTGVLRVNGRLDYETRHNVTLVAQAFDTGSPSLQNTTQVFINIININDNTPIFPQPLYEIHLLEQTAHPGVILRVGATDKDEEDYGVVRYEIIDDLRAFFSINNVTGEIYMTQDPAKIRDFDRELPMTTYSFQVKAYDSPNHPLERLWSTVPVYVYLDDLNDQCPIFTQGTAFSGQVIETADINDQVLEIFASDDDAGTNANIVFSIESSNPQLPFDIRTFQSAEEKTKVGRVTVKYSLRNQAGLYNFTVVASDMGGKNDTGKMCSVRTLVTVRVQEAINDAPVWIRPPSSNYSIDVLESQYLGMLVYDCKARDINPGDAGIVDYSFNVAQNLVQKTAEFQINPVTCIIRAEIVYDREQVSSYVLTLVAKDRGDPSASSETVLIVNVLDVNDNDPEFPLNNGETVPYSFKVGEGQNPSTAGPHGNGTLGFVHATDKDATHPNNQVFYKVLAGNNDNFFLLNRTTGEIRLNPAKAGSGLDREAGSDYSMDVIAYNEVNDDSVIRNRRRRSTNPSIVTVNVGVDDINDTPPRFTSSDYYGCVSRDATFGQSILTVQAIDSDVSSAQLMSYNKTQETTGDFFTVDPATGIIRNTKLLYEISSRTPVVTIQADDNGALPNGPGTTALTAVQIFVTDSTNEVTVKVDQPSADVRFYQDQLMRAMMNSSTSSYKIAYVCIRDIRNGIADDGQRSYTSSNVYASAVGKDPNNNYFIYDGATFRNILEGQIGSNNVMYKSLYVDSVTYNADESSSSLLDMIKEDSVLAIFIIAILLIFLALLLFILACCLIRNSKKKKIKKLRAEGNTRVEVVREQPAPVVSSVNPMYDNRGYQPEPPEDEYAVVVKKAPKAMAVAAPIIPVAVDYDDRDQEPEPFIVTEPIMSEERQVQRAPPPSDFFDPEPVIETEVMPDDELPGPSQDIDDVIDVEIRDDDDDYRPPSSRQSPRSGRESPEYRIETDIM